jgi:multidrug efflux pump subunit AcrA (membrane-fusion protein)
MLVRSILASYSRLLAGLTLALLAIALAGCNEPVAQKATPGRPVLVTEVHYESQNPARSFVGIIRPRIETDMGFRVPGKVAKRLVEVGQTVDVGQPLATLVADTRGVVTATLIDAGQVVASGQTAIRVARFAEKEAVVAIPETLLARAKDGVASVTLWSEPERKYAAKLREVAPSADPATRTYLAKFSLPDAGDKVSLGMTATLTLADPKTERVARLPLSALFSEGADPSLYIVDDKGEVVLKPVAVKSYETNNVVITGGVDEGAKVVVLGVQKLDPAQKVRVVSSLSF